jgi:hypothetical protein
MALPTINDDLKELLKILKDLKNDCKNREEESEIENTRPLVNGIHRGKKEAYTYASKKLENLLHWHSIIDLNDSSLK